MLVQIAVSIVATLSGLIPNQVDVVNTDLAQQTTLSPQEYLKQLAGPDFALLNKIVICESNWKNIPNYLYDGESGTYTAFGPFQILKSTASRYSDKDRRDVYNNIEIGVTIFNKEGIEPWQQSKNCWNKNL